MVTATATDPAATLHCQVQAQSLPTSHRWLHLMMLTNDSTPALTGTVNDPTATWPGTWMVLTIRQ